MNVSRDAGRLLAAAGALVLGVALAMSAAAQTKKPAPKKKETKVT